MEFNVIEIHVMKMGRSARRPEWTQNGRWGSFEESKPGKALRSDNAK